MESTDIPNSDSQIEENKFSQIEQILGEKLTSITIVDLNGREISLGAIQLELAVELRECLNDNVNTCFFTNYYFEHNGKRINDYDELFALDFSLDNKVYMRPDLYTERTARAHIKKFKEILYTPGVLNLSSDISDSLSTAYSASSETDNTKVDTKPDNVKGEVPEGYVEEEKTISASEEQKKENVEGKGSNQGIDQQVENESEKTAIEETKQKQELEAAKDNEEEYNRLIKSYKDALQDAKNSIPALRVDKQTIDLDKVFDMTLDDITIFEPIKCIESIGFSSFNPPPSAMQMKGDLFYLKIKTLEGPEYVITSNTRGFYINNSVEGGTFDPSPSQKVNPCFSHSLVGLLSQLSDRFSDKLEEHISKILKTDPF